MQRPDPHIRQLCLRLHAHAILALRRAGMAEHLMDRDTANQWRSKASALLREIATVAETNGLKPTS